MNRTDPMVQTFASPPQHAQAPVGGPPSIEALRRAAAHWGDVQSTFEQVFDLGDDQWLGAMVGADEAGEQARVLLLCNVAGRPLLHWGLGMRDPGQWQPPPAAMRPPRSESFDERAIRTPFERDAGGQWCLELALSPIEGRLPRALNCVLYDAQAERWLKHERRDIQLRIRVPRGAGAAGLAPILEQIVEAEAGTGSWSLMHRFNLCHDLLEEVGDDPNGLALLFAWLRYSAMRQLDWQRKYNTKPRELAHAQHRLTARLAEDFEPGTEAGLWRRRMLATVGRGGEGQQVRDQILHIMHRHRIKEQHGTWMEQWHQKLHNNTTPDDIVICQAYIAFLESDGDDNAYWRTLEAGGVTQQRLENFERPITRRPDRFPDKKHGLLHDFHQFLRLLKSVHAGTDLGTSIDAAHHLIEGGFADWLRQLAHQPVDSSEGLVHLLGMLVDARRRLHERLGAERDAANRRELLYVDLGLEARLRGVVEREDISRAPLGELAQMTRHVLANLTLTEPEREYAAALSDWRHIDLDAQADRETLLLALAASERTTRAVRGASDRLHARLQPWGEQLGRACGVAQWTIPIFSEEVVRGDLTFVLAKLVRHLEPALRQRAGLGGWQVISAGATVGRIQLAPELRRLEDEQFDEPTILVADAVTGDEEIPANVSAVLTRQIPDVVSHVAVRARNEHVLLASCLDQSEYEQLQSQRGQRVRVTTVDSGELRIEPAAEAGAEPDAAGGGAVAASSLSLQKPALRMEVIGPDAFAAENVGGKSLHLASLRDDLPGWVAVPPSAALSFGCFEHTLDAVQNREVAEHYRQLVQQVDQAPEPKLEKLRQSVQRLTLPDELRASIETVCEAQGIALPAEREALWSAIRAVWASKWTDRAFRARRRLKLSHDDLVMAVLLQQLVEADYAFVIHTIDPTTRDASTLYAEVVVGLGETLVGNEPGMPLGFRVNKEALVVELVSLPSKSVARHGGGVIARSDTNGEDLPGYAGAGLYDSVPTEPMTTVMLDYDDEPLVRDRAFRQWLCRSIAELGIAMERAAGSAQDIEGAVCGDRFYALQTRAQVGL